MSPTTLLDGVTFTMSPNAQVHVGVRARDLVPARAQAHRFGLLLQIGVLAARHLVEIHVRRARTSDALSNGR